MRLLVTGGAGFIGSHYVRSALTGVHGATGIDSLVVLDKLTYAGNPRNLDPVAGDPRLELVEADITDAAAVDALMARADVVVHFAAESHVDRSIDGAAGFVHTNVVGTQVLLDAAVRHDVDKFVHVSTDEVYGTIPEGSWPEDHPLEPNSPYSASKASSDLLVRSFHRTHGLPACITRCSNNYGPYQFPEKVMPLFITNLMRGGTVPLYGDGLNVRDWLHVDDHCRGIQLVVDGGRPGEVYNIGGGRNSPTVNSPNGSSRRSGPAGNASVRSRTARGTTAATRSTSRRSRPNSATPLSTPSTRVWPRRSSGTATTRPGGPRCSRRSPPRSEETRRSIPPRVIDLRVGSG